MSSLVTIAGIVTLLGAAMIGGVFFAFSSFVMKALARLPSAEGIAAMQSINIVVLNRSPINVAKFFSGSVFSKVSAGLKNVNVLVVT